MEYNKEQVKDIKERTEKAAEALKALDLQPAVAMQMANLGNDVFGIKPIAYLQDLKYVRQTVQEDKVEAKG
jgi:hypothetical protein